MFDYLLFRYRRSVRHVRRIVRIARQASVNYVDRHLWGKWHQIGLIRRFLIVWWAVIAITLIGLLQQINSLIALGSVSVPEPGGIYTEAAIGTVNTLNPLLSQTTTESD